MIRHKIINTYVNAISLDNVVTEVFAAIGRGEKKHIVFINALKIYEIKKDARMAKAVEEAEFILADGVPTVWASILLGRRLPGRVNGTDLFERLLKESAHRNTKVFLLGASQKSLERLESRLRELYPALQIAGARNGYFTDSQDGEVIGQINQSGADILFLGFSSPKKELWAHKYKHAITVPIIDGVGGSFDVVAGIIPRAPLWMQKSGLEWLHRVIKQPRRMFRRYLVSNSVFVYLVLRSFITERILGKSSS
jgi:N-acetylglucosaminyldiphosphoundecaprenol N-acetyl-beta-D-mannosaminyltransferase